MIIAEPPGKIKEVFMETINSEPMFVVEAAVNELRQLSSLCSIMIWMSDESGHPEINAMGDTVEVLRKGLDAQIKTLDNIQW